MWVLADKPLDLVCALAILEKYCRQIANVAFLAQGPEQARARRVERVIASISINLQHLGHVNRRTTCCKDGYST